jgi:cobalt-zinc-cadmium efflux system membrane fusion protein
MYMKNIFLIALYISISSLLVCCKGKKHVKETKPEHLTKLTLSGKQLQHVKIDEVRLVPEADQLTAVGEVSFAEDNVVRIYPLVSGTVEKVTVSLGDYVNKGQVLATLLSTDISQYQRDYNISKSNFEVEEKNLQRSQELFQAGMQSEKEFASAKKDYANASSEFSERKQILELYGGSVNDLDARYQIKSPRSGFIVERNITEGTQIRNDNGTNVFTISDLKTVWVWANVHESDIATVHEGDNVVVRTIAYPDKTFEGTIKKIGTMLDPDSRVIKVRTELVNNNGLLKPQMFATIGITSKQLLKVIAIPKTAIVLESNRYFVMREVEPQKFEKVSVSIGKTFGNFYEILSGLNAGDKIVIEGSLFVLTAFNQL